MVVTHITIMHLVWFRTGVAPAKAPIGGVTVQGSVLAMLLGPSNVRAGKLLIEEMAKLLNAELDDNADPGDPKTTVSFEEADEILARESAARRVNAAYAIDASLDDQGRVRPAHIKERVRALGPTVRPDLTLKPTDPEALNWVI